MDFASRWSMMATALLFGALLPAAAALGAEATWLRPDAYAVTPGATVSFEIARGEVFEPAAATASPARCDAAARLGGAPVVVARTSVAAPPRFAVTLPRPGVAVLSCDLGPVNRIVSSDAVERYLRELHAPESVAMAVAEQANGGAVRETRAVRLKSYLRVGEPEAAERGWAEPAPLGFDLVPAVDPTTVTAGADFPVTVFQDAKPAAEVIVTFLSTGENREHVVVTDDSGRAHAAMDVGGVWLVRGMRMTAPRAATWETQSVEATIFVRGASAGANGAAVSANAPRNP